jgi:hypothetical protein
VAADAPAPAAVLVVWPFNPPTELVETHVRAGQTNRSGWWLSADQVIWLCPGCAAPLLQPARTYPRERR